jgi:hypothetical protein
MEDHDMQCFKDFVDVNCLIDEYEQVTGNHLRIQKSQVDKFRVYRCCEHVNCSFQVRFSRRRSDGYFVLSTSPEKLKHSGERRAPKASGDRNYKQRWQGLLTDVVVRVLETKAGAPQPKDIVHTAGTMQKRSVPYHAAYRALHHDKLLQKKASVKNFQMIGPYLTEMEKSNTGSEIGYHVGETCEIEYLYFFPGFIKDVLTFVRPVISVDAAHLKSVYKGMLYIASVKTGYDDIYPIGFMIATGNEDRKNWTTMLELLKKAFPIISDVFPNNLETSCAFHIKENVKTRFGEQVAAKVMRMAKTYSVREFDHLLEEIEQMRPAAAVYISAITQRGVVWTNSQCHDTRVRFIPRFGQITSNTSESVNSMLDSARHIGWMDAMEKIVDVMVTRICTCRVRDSDRPDSEIVPRAQQLVKYRYESTANMVVMELEQGGGVYRTSVTDSYDENDPVAMGGRLQHVTAHQVTPILKHCSCGVWQSTLLPCRHACAVFRKAKGFDLNYILVNFVHDYYTFGFVKQTFKKNVLPVSVDTLAYDRKTKPPFQVKNSVGRPKKHARIRRRGNILCDADSNISCSNCGKRGHNIRTCHRRTQEDLR